MRSQLHVLLLARLEALDGALLDFTSARDLERWFYS